MLIQGTNMPANSFDPGDPPEFIRPINSSSKHSSMNGDHLSSRFVNSTTTVVEDLIESASSRVVKNRRRSCSHLNQSTECRRRRSKERKLLNCTQNSHSEHKLIQTNNNNNNNNNNDKMPLLRPVERTPPSGASSWTFSASTKRTPPDEVARFYGNHFLELPTTDYTYSPLSPLHGRDVLPGIPQLPVLRRGLIPLDERRLSSSRRVHYEEVTWWRRTITTIVTTITVLTTVLSRSVAAVQTIFESSSRLGDRSHNKIWWLIFPVVLLVLWYFSSSTADDESFVETGALRQLNDTAVNGAFNWAIWLFESAQSAAGGIFSAAYRAFFSFFIFLNSIINAINSDNAKNEVPVMSNLPHHAENDASVERSIVSDSVRLNEMIQLAVGAMAINYTTALQLVTKEMHQIVARLEAVETNVKALEARLDQTTSYFEELVTADKQESTQSVVPLNTDNITLEVMKSVMKSMLETYHADRTGKPDFALQSNGGVILGVRCTKTYKGHQPEAYFLSWFLYPTNDPETIIKPGVMPGECWAFEGAEGYVDIGLAMPVFITAFTLEHTPKVLTPKKDISSAPKRFSVWGIDSIEDDEMIPLGRFEFQDNGESMQTFNAEPVNKAFKFIELKIESNHGNMDYTCLYRFRVHGVPLG